MMFFHLILLLSIIFYAAQARSHFTINLDSMGLKHIDFTHLNDAISIKPLPDGLSHIITTPATNDMVLIRDTNRFETSILFDAMMLKLACPRRFTQDSAKDVHIAVSIGEEGLFHLGNHHSNTITVCREQELTQVDMDRLSRALLSWE